MATQQRSTLQTSSTIINRINRRTVNPDTTVLLKIRKDVLKIERILKLNLAAQIRNRNQENTNDQRESRENQERRVENKKTKFNPRNIKKNLTPRLGIIEYIKRFVLFTFLGYLFVKAYPHLPKLLKLVNLLKVASDVVGFITRTLLDGFIFVIQKGYETWDKIKKLKEDIEKIKIKDAFDKFTGAFKKVIDSTKTILDFVGNLVNPLAPLLKLIPNQQEQEQQPITSPKPEGKADGGPIGTPKQDNQVVTRGNVPVKRPITRKLKVPKKAVPRIKTVPEPLKVGKDAGGEGNIRKFYRSPKPGSFNLFSFLFSKKQNENAKKDTPADSIIDISKTLRKVNLFSGIASIGSDIAIGQKPSKNVYKNAAKDVLYLAEFLIMKRGLNFIQSASAMENGGSVTGSPIGNINDKESLSIIETLIRNSIERAANKAFEDAKRSIMKKAVEAIEEEEGGPGGIRGGGAMYAINMKDFSEEDIDALGRMISAESQSEGPLGKALVMNVILNRYRAIKSGLARPSDFNITGKAAKDITIRDVLFAEGQFQPVRDGSFNNVSSTTGSSALASALSASGNDPENLKKALMNEGYNASDADYLVRSIAFYSSGSTPFRGMPELSYKNHKFQQSPNVRLTGPLQRFEATVQTLEDFQAAIPDGSTIEGGLVPSEQYITSRFGMRGGRLHKGVDYAGPGIDHEPVTIIKPGVVTFAGFESGGGNSVYIRHNDGSETWYMHLRDGSISVKEGQPIKPGTVIGRVGNTGRSFGTHLHFQVFLNGNLYNNPQKVAPSFFRFGRVKIIPPSTPQHQGLVTPPAPILPPPKKMRGGIVPDFNLKTHSYASYESPNRTMMVLVQPVVIERPIPYEVPVPMPVPFPVSKGVNNKELSRA